MNGIETLLVDMSIWALAGLFVSTVFFFGFNLFRLFLEGKAEKKTKEKTNTEEREG